MAQRDPETYGTIVTRPDDFAAFWDETLADLARVPLNVECHEVPLRSTADVVTYDVSWSSYQHLRIAGWLCVPRTAGPHPGLLVFPGYVSEPLVPRAWAREGYAALSVAVRGKLRSNRHFNPGYPGLLTYNIVDRETYGYRGLYCDAWRGVDVLRALPWVDGTRIGATGSSQGGALTMLTAAMRPEVVAAAAGAPYLTGMADAIQLTSSYPYQEINDYLRLYPERQPVVEHTLRYFDVLNFAPIVQCPVLLNIGLQDDVCPPETGYALIAALRCPKDLHAYDQAGHDAGEARHGPLLRRFLAQHLKPASLHQE